MWEETESRPFTKYEDQPQPTKEGRGEEWKADMRGQDRGVGSD
jgi:hypothetical protein